MWPISSATRNGPLFKQLSNDEERDNFIEQFWLRRDPTPDTEETNIRKSTTGVSPTQNGILPPEFPAGRPIAAGMYIMYGPADEIDSHPSGRVLRTAHGRGRRRDLDLPFETWRYRYIEGIGQEIIMEFVDTCMCGDYHMTLGPF